MIEAYFALKVVYGIAVLCIMGVMLVLCIGIGIREVIGTACKKKQPKKKKG